jgi:PAS domain-containing protein
MRRTVAGETLAKQKLAAVQKLQPEFEANFHFIQEVHGQRRFAAFPVIEMVHYVHALWICEWKERLLSVHMNIGRYEGQQCLSLLRRWQEGETAAVVAFLQHKLGGLPFANLTRQIQEATTVRQADDSLLQRLVHGRLVLLNRDMNLMQAFDAFNLLKLATSGCERVLCGLKFFSRQKGVCARPNIASAASRPCCRASACSCALLKCVSACVTSPSVNTNWPRITAAILESITDGFLHVNQRMEEFLEKKQADLLGKSIWDVFPQLRGSSFADHVHHAMVTQQVAHFEIRRF